MKTKTESISLASTNFCFRRLEFVNKPVNLPIVGVMRILITTLVFLAIDTEPIKADIPRHPHGPEWNLWGDNDPFTNVNTFEFDGDPGRGTVIHKHPVI